MQATQEAARGASPEAIQRHYDIGNDFYRLWLDQTMSYSCALWEGDADRLETAQIRKIDYHIAQAKAAGADRVLDIGCGWGAVLKRLTTAHRAGRAVGLTLSREQEEWAVATPNPRIEVRRESWVDHSPAAPYDAIISIGAFEHFARPEWTSEQQTQASRRFFTRCHEWLTPGGRLSLQTIAYGSAKREETQGSSNYQFLLGEIFPETELPTLNAILAASDGLFEIVMLRNDRHDYARTCDTWAKRLAVRRRQATEAAGEAVVARYLRYLKLSAILFHEGYTNLLRIAFRRVDRRAVNRK
jgi:cyclopropane-fatty-acyl-phospholipid synthase